MSVRAKRVAEQIKVEMGDILTNVLKDPNIGFVTVTDVEVTRGLQEATVYFSVYGDDAEKEKSFKGLERAKGLIRSEIGKRIRLRKVPELHFEFDYSIEYGNRIETLLKQVKVEDE